MIFGTAFLLGLMGSLHCVGMCGPIAMALPLGTKDRWLIFKKSIAYHLGRISTYGLLGIFLGLLGQGIAMAGAQKYFSIGIGILMLIIAVFAIDIEGRIVKLPVLNRFYQTVQQHMGELLQKKGFGPTIGLGLLNGFLPCGMVFMALAGSITTSHYLYGSFFMIAFGLGTLPLMLGVTLFGQYLPQKVKFYFRKMAPVVLAGFAVLLIMRGFNVSFPKELVFMELMKDPVMCH